MVLALAVAVGAHGVAPRLAGAVGALLRDVAAVGVVDRVDHAGEHGALVAEAVLLLAVEALALVRELEGALEGGVVVESREGAGHRDRYVPVVPRGK